MKRIFTICLLVCLLTLSIPAQAASIDTILRVDNCREWVSLRDTPSTSSKRLAKIPRNGLVTYLGSQSNGFSFVLYGNKTGFVLSKYLVSQNRAMAVSSSDSYADLLDKPIGNASHSISLPNGTRVIFIARAENGFFKASYEGTIGYIQSDKLFGLQPKQVEDAIVINCNSYISLRSQPMTSAKRIREIPLGAEVKNFGPVGNGMSYVYYNGQYGFVLTKYLDYGQSLPQNSIKRATLVLSDSTAPSISQSISNPALLNELQAMVLRATPANSGQYPPYGQLTFEMQDGEKIQFTRITDGCPCIIGTDGTVRNMTKADAQRFWEIFDEVCKVLSI